MTWEGSSQYNAHDCLGLVACILDCENKTCMESTYWCRWNGKRWEPFLLQPLTAEFVATGERDETTSSNPIVEQVLGNVWNSMEIKGFRDGYTAGCLEASSGNYKRVAMEQSATPQPTGESAPCRDHTKHKRKRKRGRHAVDKTSDKIIPNKTYFQPSRDKVATEEMQQEIQEMEASIDAKFVQILREKSPPMWPILGLREK